MSSIKLNSSGGGSVSLSAASSSTDVTIQFPSGNSSLNQALVASDSSGTLGWSTVPNSTAVPIFQTTTHNASLDAANVTNGTPTTAIEWGYNTSNSGTFDTNSGYDATNYWYVIPQDGYYKVTMCVKCELPNLADSAQNALYYVWLVHAPANNKSSWDTLNTVKVYNKSGVQTGDTPTVSFGPSPTVSGIFECNAGDAIKTAGTWDKHTDTTNTTTTYSVDGQNPSSNIISYYWNIEYLRPL